MRKAGGKKVIWTGRFPKSLESSHGARACSCDLVFITFNNSTQSTQSSTIHGLARRCGKSAKLLFPENVGAYWNGIFRSAFSWVLIGHHGSLTSMVFNSEGQWYEVISPRNPSVNIKLLIVCWLQASKKNNVWIYCCVTTKSRPRKIYQGLGQFESATCDSAR